MKMAKIKSFEEYTIRYKDWFESNKLENNRAKIRRKK
jgi:hypothetical protein